MTKGGAKLTGHRDLACVCNDQKCSFLYCYNIADLLYFFLNPHLRTES